MERESHSPGCCSCRCWSRAARRLYTSGEREVGRSDPEQQNQDRLIVSEDCGVCHSNSSMFDRVMGLRYIATATARGCRLFWSTACSVVPISGFRLLDACPDVSSL